MPLVPLEQPKRGIYIEVLYQNATFRAERYTVRLAHRHYFFFYLEKVAALCRHF